MKKLIFVMQDNCKPCQQLKPLVEECCFQLNIELQYIDVTNNWLQAVELGVKTTPQLFVEQDGIKDIIQARRAIPLLKELRTKFEL